MVEFTDFKGDEWLIFFTEKCQKTLHKGELFWKVWVQCPKRPRELRNYPEIPIPVFTEWWT